MVTKTVFALPFFGVTTTPARHVPAAAPVTDFLVTVQAVPLVFVSRLTVAPFGTLTLNVESSARSATFCPTINVGDEPVGVGTVVGATVVAGVEVPALGGVVVEVPWVGLVVDDPLSVDGAAMFCAPSAATNGSRSMTRGGCLLGVMSSTSNGGTMNDNGVNDHDNDSLLVPPAVVSVAATT